MRVLVADVQPLIRRGIAGLLGEAFPDWSFLHAGSLPQAMEHLNTATPDTRIDAAIVDLDLPGMNGSAGIRTLRTSAAAPRIALLAGTDDRNTILNCLAAGAHGYLLKADASEQLAGAMRTLICGGVYVPPRLSSCAPVRSSGVITGLTARQREVLTLLLDGSSTKDIAKSLSLGVGTVKIHLGGIYRTLAVRNRAEAVARCRVEAGLGA